jgi:cell wall-associated NlpC family hydrolase
LSAGLLTGTLSAPSAVAGTAPAYWGRIASAVQHRDGSVAVWGWAYDRSNAKSSSRVCLVVAGNCVKALTAQLPSPQFDSAHHITGRHRFAVLLSARGRPGVPITLRTATSAPVTLDTVAADSPGARAVRWAKSFVGRRYVEGGASPRTGFDCSGLTMYVYDRAGIAALPHNAEQQRHVRYMHRVTRAGALPGDLIFYFSGGPAYHVAIYAGHGYQYAAATPRDGVRYQRIWSNSIEFRTDWH